MAPSCSLGALVTDIRQSAKDPTDQRTYDLSALHRYLASRRPPALRFVAWDWIASVESARSDHATSIRAWCTAAADLPLKRRVDWPPTVINAMWANRALVSEQDGKVMQQLADSCFETEILRLRALALAGLDSSEHEPADEQMFIQMLAVARARELAGATGGAREIVDLALTVEPGNGAFQKLRQDLRSQPRPVR